MYNILMVLASIVFTKPENFMTHSNNPQSVTNDTWIDKYCQNICGVEI